MLGANVDCDAHMLFQFGVMGSILYSGIHNIKRPRVGLLNIGSEETKGQSARTRQLQIVESA